MKQLTLLPVVAVSAIILLVAYRTYGRLLGRLLRLDPSVETPAVALRDDEDYAPIEPKFLLGQHFSAIAAAGPIVGPILAGVMFGWLPALVWILVGSIFIGGVHDMTSLVASIRHRARSIAEVVGEHMSRRSYLLFLTFIWISLVYIIVAFTDVTAASFVGSFPMEDGEIVSGGGIATSSLLYLIIPVAMGILMRYTKLSLGWATVIFVPLVGLAIWVGQLIPFDLGQTLHLSEPAARKTWDVALLVYCFAASVAPMWLLLQPRGHLGGYFLYLAILGGGLGLILGGQTVQYPAFLGWSAAGENTLFPILFITIACGACSGFHSVIASGTTSKQLKRETDARPIGYGAMLLEAMVAVISLCCVMALAPGSPALKNPKPNYIYAMGIGSFLQTLGVPAKFGISFGLMAFTTFVYDTLDVCTRLGRYILQELTGWQGWPGRIFATMVTAGVPMFFILQSPVDPTTGKVVELWRVFWTLFGASNQLLAALTLLGVTVWLWRTRRAAWVWLVTGLPTVWMYVMSVWALGSMTARSFVGRDGFQLPSGPVPWVGLVLIGLALLMLVEGIRVILGARLPTLSPPNPTSSAAMAAS